MFCFGVVVLGWSAYCLPILTRQAPLEGVARRVLARESYQRDALVEFNAVLPGSLSKWQRPSALAAQAVVELRMLEQAVALSKMHSIDLRFAETERALRKTLSTSPANAFFWIAYFWVENNRLGFRPSHLDFLEMSYETGPSEGWVATTRNRFAIALFRTLPNGLADMAVGEFARLVGSRLYDAAIDVLSRQSEDVGSRLLASLSTVEFDDREQFAKAAYRQGFDWNVPGVDRPEWRPWH